MKPFVVSAFIFILLASPVVHSAEYQSELSYISNQIISRVDDGDITEILQQFDLYKEAGLSFQPGLTVPKSVRNKDNEELAVLLGMIMFDANYAMVFGRMGNSIDNRMFVRTDLLPRLDQGSRLDLNPVRQDLLERLTRDPQDEEARRLVNEHVASQIRSNAEIAENDLEVMQVLVFAYYGAIIQGLYVATSLSMNLPVTPEIEELFEYQLIRLQYLDELIHNLQHSQIRDVLGQEKICSIIDPIIERLMVARGELTPELIKDLNEIATQARSEYVGH
ncbi:hypothetical protein [Desulfonatronovibrio magnus]|uniref:hypothetical protein n=1 Tax=Desulfonatronovibrio magnus TaxID=698827 RepID=UPI0005EB9520|nr:hypothetical protein [Desulfonatronovibrio magnus]